MSKLSAASKGMARVGKLLESIGLRKRGMDGVKATTNAGKLSTQVKKNKARRRARG